MTPALQETISGQQRSRLLADVSILDVHDSVFVGNVFAMGARTIVRDARVAIVTGAAGGLGSAVAGLLDGDGVRVALVDVDEARLDEVRGRLPLSTAFPTDLAIPGACDTLVGEVIGRLGRVDILVNAAAILARRELPDATPDYFDRVYAVNARAPFFLCRAVLPDMALRGWGRIVNVTSTGVYQGGERMTSAAYESSKGAVAVLTKMFAKAGAKDGVPGQHALPGWHAHPDAARGDVPGDRSPASRRASLSGGSRSRSRWRA